MQQNIAQKLIRSHLLEGELIKEQEIQLKIDQTLCQDATGTLVMLELEAMGLSRVKTEISAQYVDHNLIQEDYKNADDHLFLQSAAERFGLWFSRAGNGVSHPLHMEFFGKPGKTLLGSDSHTCAGGALGMLAIGAGGLEVALAMAGFPFAFNMPKILKITLTGKLPAWVSAKDIILEMLRRRSVKGGVGYIFEYAGPSLKYLDIWDRHVIANMGAESGATATIFPSDNITLKFLKSCGREADWQAIQADKGATYDEEVTIDLSQLEPLIALPSSPDKVVPVKEIAGRSLYQAYIGSSANPGFRDFAIAACMVKDKQIKATVSFDVNPASRNILEELAKEGYLSTLIHSGARIHQAGCNGCIGMGQAPATQKNSLRTVPRNFPGRSGTKEDSIYLCSPETATASALTGVITDPRDLHLPYPKIKNKQKIMNKAMMQLPLSEKESQEIKLVKGPNIISLQVLEAFPKNVSVKVILQVGDNISTDEIMPAGARVLPFRSNIPKLTEFAFDMIDETYPKRAKSNLSQGMMHTIVGGENYGQGSSREHAALAPRYLGLQCVIAKSFARIHAANLVNFGILPLTFLEDDAIALDDIIHIENVIDSLKQNKQITATINQQTQIKLKHHLSPRQIDVLAMGGLINWVKHSTTNRAES